MYIGGGVSGVNLACSGAKTSSFSTEGLFKPGLDFYNSGGHEGQALMLQHFAAAHNVKLVAVSIGGNNFNFAGIVQNCIEDFLISPEWWPDYCSEEGYVTKTSAPSNVATVKSAIEGAIQNVAQAMTNAGYSSSQYSIVVQNYPSPIPSGTASATRRAATPVSRSGAAASGTKTPTTPTRRCCRRSTAPSSPRPRQPGCRTSRRWNCRGPSTAGGCAKKASACSRKRACRTGKQPAREQDRVVQPGPHLTTLFGPYELQEDLHPNYWAQLALRNCLTQAYNGGVPRGGTCTISASGLNSAGEPNMSLHYSGTNPDGWAPPERAGGPSVPLACRIGPRCRRETGSAERG